MNKKIHLLVVGLLALVACQQTSKTSEIITGRGIEAPNGMLASAHPLASKAGAEILAQGGNAFDAAVCVHFALAVVYPRAGNIGGGGFAVYRKNNGETGTLDFREKAPLQASRNMYLDSMQNVIPDLSSTGALSVGVPGSVQGMIDLHKKLGTIAFENLIEPAIKLAENGFAITKDEADKLNSYQEAFIKANGTAMYFVKNWQAGDTMHLPALAKTLKAIQKNGRDGFYKGDVAAAMLKKMNEKAGITQADLDAYKTVWRKPIEIFYKNYKVISMPPPSSGGIALAQLLKGSENFDWKASGHNSAATIHFTTELQRRVYADRASYLGDPDFYPVPQQMLLDSTYLAQRFENIKLNKKTNSSDIKEGSVEIIESIETTHFSIVDKQGNAIAITTTLNGNYGSKVFVENAGFFLNNEMDDFSVKPGVPNQFGLIGAEANAIAPQKRMLSSMTPTILEKNNELFMVVGTPGGATIITLVYQAIINVIEYDMDIQQAVDAKKTHSQWLPDIILYEENGLDSSIIKNLNQMGHVLESRPYIGKLDAVLVLSNGMLQGGSDPRGDDISAGVK
jgi:gamma-glutamyltranspeptidase/glutathione hydrolase